MSLFTQQWSCLIDWVVILPIAITLLASPPHRRESSVCYWPHVERRSCAMAIICWNVPPRYWFLVCRWCWCVSLAERQPAAAHASGGVSLTTAETSWRDRPMVRSAATCLTEWTWFPTHPAMFPPPSSNRCDAWHDRTRTWGESSPALACSDVGSGSIRRAGRSLRAVLQQLSARGVRAWWCVGYHQQPWCPTGF